MALVVRAQVYPRARYHVMVRQMPLDLDSANSAQLDLLQQFRSRQSGDSGDGQRV